MRVVGIICEYNPFHNGHALHLRAAKHAAQADFVICAMSGAFVQRGEPAIVDKWARAAMALHAGADLVLELPAHCAVRPAQDFALGAVALLDALGVCTHLCFGSELPLDALQQALSAPEDQTKIRAALRRGESYPRAVAQSGAQALPNATLGIEYLRALNAHGSAMLPLCVHREAPHHAHTLQEIASAGAIRLATHAKADVACAMPREAHRLYQAALARQEGPTHLDRLSPLLLHTLRSAHPDTLAHLPGAGEGLINRLIRAAKGAASVQELLDAAKCKRYTMARLRRLCAHVLLGTPQELCAPPRATYARVLGFRKEAAVLLQAISKQGSIPLLTKLPAHIEEPSLAHDLRTQDVWALSCPRIQPAALDYTHGIEMLKMQI